MQGAILVGVALTRFAPRGRQSGEDIQTLATAFGDAVKIRIANSQPGTAWACVPACGFQTLPGGSGGCRSDSAASQPPVDTTAFMSWTPTPHPCHIESGKSVTRYKRPKASARETRWDSLTERAAYGAASPTTTLLRRAQMGQSPLLRCESLCAVSLRSSRPPAP